jgi:uncharacterized protein (DUF1015 family)
MAALHPFRALRPAREAAVHVAAVPYDVVTRYEARALADGNPLSFLHVSRAEIDLPDEVNPYDDAVYAKAVENLRRLTAEAPLSEDERPGLYVYRLRMGAHVQTGVAGCYSLDEYDRDAIRKHERTRRDKEDDRTRHMIALRAQTGPVFLTYHASETIDGIIQRVTAASPLYDFVASDGIAHILWRVGAEDEAALVRAFESVPALYIADGHHRAASAARARRDLGTDRFLGVAFPDDQVQIFPYNRVVKDLGSRTPEAFVSALASRFPVEDGPAAPGRRGDVSMFIQGRWRVIHLGAAEMDRSGSDALDVSRLQELVLGPLLGIGDVRIDPRIDFVGGGRGTAALEALVTSGKAAVAFSMHPVSVRDLMRVSDAGGIMPPKSTWFEPKLRDGLLSYALH